MSEFTIEIDAQQIPFELDGADLEALKTALRAALGRNGQDLLRAAPEVGAALAMQQGSEITVGLDRLQERLRSSQFDVSLTEILNGLLRNDRVQIAEFTIESSGQFTIALKVEFQDLIKTEDLSPEIRQIIQGPEIGLGMVNVL